MDEYTRKFIGKHAETPYLVLAGNGNHFGEIVE